MLSGLTHAALERVIDELCVVVTVGDESGDSRADKEVVFILIRITIVSVELGLVLFKRPFD